MAKTVMFVHGMFLNPVSWDQWRAFFEQRGFETLAPAWPLHDGAPSSLRANPPPGLGSLSLDQVIAKLEDIAATHRDLVVVGHSVGGLLTQILVSRGLARLGVPICSVAPNRMMSLDWSFLKNSAAITNPLKGDELYPMDADGFFQNFGNTMTRAASDAAFAQFAMHESRNVLRDCLGDAGKIDVNAPHVPMLFIGADKDEIIPAALCEKNAAAYDDEGSHTDYVEFQNRGHFICGQAGWEDVATHIVEWIDAHDSERVGPSLARRLAIEGRLL